MQLTVLTQRQTHSRSIRRTLGRPGQIPGDIGRLDYGITL